MSIQRVKEEAGDASEASPALFPPVALVDARKFQTNPEMSLVGSEQGPHGGRLVPAKPEFAMNDDEEEKQPADEEAQGAPSSAPGSRAADYDEQAEDEETKVGALGESSLVAAETGAESAAEPEPTQDQDALTGQAVRRDSFAAAGQQAVSPEPESLAAERPSGSVSDESGRLSSALVDTGAVADVSEDAAKASASDGSSVPPPSEIPGSQSDPAS